MKWMLCPDSFKGSLSAEQAAQAMAEGKLPRQWSAAFAGLFRDQRLFRFPWRTAARGRCRYCGAPAADRRCAGR